MYEIVPNSWIYDCNTYEYEYGHTGTRCVVWLEIKTIRRWRDTTYMSYVGLGLSACLTRQLLLHRLSCFFVCPSLKLVIELELFEMFDFVTAAHTSSPFWSHFFLIGSYLSCNIIELYAIITFGALNFYWYIWRNGRETRGFEHKETHTLGVQCIL